MSNNQGVNIVNQLIKKEKLRQQNGIELIASENFVSPNVEKALGSVFTNKYAEGYPGRRYYGGCEVVDELEIFTMEQGKKLFGAKYINVQPHSGSHANQVVMMSVLNIGDSILGLGLNDGGHLTHGSPVSFSGTLYKPHSYNLDKDGFIDYDDLYKKALEIKPKLIICGGSAYSRDWDYKKFREIADMVNSILLADISHTSGLIATGFLENPINHAHIVTSTTQKTLRGPRGGIIMMGDDFDNPKGLTKLDKNTKTRIIKKMSEVLDFTVFPFTSGGPHMHTIAAKAVAFSEALDSSFKDYCNQIIKNSKAMSNEFTKLGYKIASGGTDNHMFLVDLSNKNITGKEAEKALEQANITVNKNMIPGDKKSPFITSGIRIGTPNITTRGLIEDDCKRIVHLINSVIENKDKDDVIQVIRNDVSNMMSKYPLFYN